MNDSLTELRCACGAALLKEDVDFERGVASCSVCDQVMMLAARGPRSRAKLPLPKRFTVDASGAISFPWRQWDHVFGLLFMAVWMPGVTQFHRPPLLFLIVGGLVAAQALIGLVNHTRLSLEGDTLVVRQRPVPWPWDVRLARAQIEQLFSVDVSESGKGGVKPRFAVKALLKDGSERFLVRGLREHTQALFLEQALERMLDLRDRPVPGELPRE